MKKRATLVISIFLFFTVIFLLEKAIFTITQSPESLSISISDFFAVLYHGLPLDLSTSGYLTAFPALTLIASIWVYPSIIRKINNVYFGLILTVLAIIMVADFVLYPYWGYHFDATVFLYLESPKSAMASATTSEIILSLVATILIVFCTYKIYSKLIGQKIKNLDKPKSNLKTSLVLILLCGCLFLFIRGGVTTSTMNVGRAYFSETMYLNHAAINPHFNLLYSSFKSEKFEKQYQFFDKQEAISIFEDLHKVEKNDSIPQLLKTKRPNIFLFILESFSKDVTSDPTIAPNFVQFAKEGIYFDNFYANGYRTDRGLVAILSGYPAHPTVPIIKYPTKTQSLPSIPKALKEQAGYDTNFFYGGDVDFANMRSYFIGSCSTNKMVVDVNFPIKERITKWGAPDKFLINKLYEDMVGDSTKKSPFIATTLTLSSHEPFDVPTRKFDEPYLNSIAYSDSCLGDFIAKLKKSDLWDNSLVVMVADHCMQTYPHEYNNYDIRRFQIPMIWMGGAITEPQKVSTYGSQNDIATTLLHQLDLQTEEFTFSKNMLNPDSNHFGFFIYSNGFGMVSEDGYSIYDNNKNALLESHGDSTILKDSKAYLQNMYLDLGSR